MQEQLQEHSIKLSAYFGTHIAEDNTEVSDDQFESFLTTYVDPKIEGYSVAEVLGRYGYNDSTVIKERTFVLEVYLVADDILDNVIDSILNFVKIYKSLYKQESVLVTIQKTAIKFL